MSIKCFDLQDPNPIGVLKGVYHGGIESCDIIEAGCLNLLWSHVLHCLFEPSIKN